MHILCEGQTEERFVNEVLAPYLQQFQIYSKPILLLTSKKKNAKGAMISYGQAKRDLGILIKRYKDNATEKHLFTTMFDFYALPDDFPGFKDSAQIFDKRARIACLEDALSADVGSSSFIPYLQLHEFEALLFANIGLLSIEYPRAKNQIQKLKDVAAHFKDPEMINDSPETAPSKRIINALNTEYHYNKVKSGPAITALIGIEQLMEKCVHFKSWIEKIRNAALK